MTERDEPFRVSPFDSPAHADSAGDRRKRYRRTQPQCEICFKRDNPDKVPVRVVPDLRETERCVTCGVWMRDGIYIRIDPAEAPYPSLLKNDPGRERF